jgi:zinc transporter, ZIP family
MRRTWLLGLVPLVLVALAIGTFAALDGPGLGERRGPPAEELAVERTTLEPGVIELAVRNDGPDAVEVAQVVVNDAFAQFTGAEHAIERLETETLRIQQPWVEGEAYETRRPAPRSPTPSTSRSRRRTPTSASTG